MPSKDWPLPDGEYQWLPIKDNRTDRNDIDPATRAPVPKASERGSPRCDSVAAVYSALKMKVYDVGQNESYVPSGRGGNHEYSHRGNQAARQPRSLVKGTVGKNEKGREEKRLEDLKIEDTRKEGWGGNGRSHRGNQAARQGRS
ncbi:hypothetical protein EDB83DRAFT_2327309 [Lactarius deliciosus]|nr:hypothetical protein EDB83DRAFT_2327309 [Lactarius deliciosus]